MRGWDRIEGTGIKVKLMWLTECVNSEAEKELCDAEYDLGQPERR